MPHPKTKSDELIDRLNAYSPDDTVDELTERIIRNEADKLAKIDAVSSYVALGALECLLGNVDECEANHQRSIKLNRSSHTLSNYASSLNNLGMYGKALDYFNQACQIDPDNLDLLNKYVTTALDVCQFSLARSLLLKQDRLDQDVPRLDKERVLYLADVADSLGLTDDITLPICTAANSFLKHAGYRGISYTHDVVWDGDLPIISYYNTIKASDEKLISLNVEFSSYLAEHVEELVSDKFVLFFEKAS